MKGQQDTDVKELIFRPRQPLYMVCTKQFAVFYLTSN